MLQRAHIFCLTAGFTSNGSIIGSGQHPSRGSHGRRLCVGCGGAILDQYILRVAPNLEWHAACLKCSQCNKVLDENHTCFVRDGAIFCKQDYLG